MDQHLLYVVSGAFMRGIRSQQRASWQEYARRRPASPYNYQMQQALNTITPATAATLTHTFAPTCPIPTPPVPPGVFIPPHSALFTWTDIPPTTTYTIDAIVFAWCRTFAYPSTAIAAWREQIQPTPPYTILWDWAVAGTYHIDITFRFRAPDGRALYHQVPPITQFLP